MRFWRKPIAHLKKHPHLWGWGCGVKQGQLKECRTFNFLVMAITQSQCMHISMATLFTHPTWASLVRHFLHLSMND